MEMLGFMPRRLQYTHTHALICLHIGPHELSDINVPICAHSYAHQHTCIDRLTLTYQFTCKFSFTYPHVSVHIFTCTCIDTHIKMLPDADAYFTMCLHICKYPHNYIMKIVHSCILTLKYFLIFLHIYIHRYMHIHTYTYSYEHL